MHRTQTPTGLILGGIAGIVGTVLYVLVSFLPFHQNVLYFMAMAWPILSIVFVYALYQYIAYKHQSMANQLAFVFAVLGFTIVACMISVQLAVNFGLTEQMAVAPDNEEFLGTLRRPLRLIDLGLDVAWDLFIGTSLIFLFTAIKRHPKFPLPWAIPALVLGIGLIVLNVYTFPSPPNTAGLFDIGPLIGLYIISLSIKLVVIGLNQRKRSKS